MLGVTLVKKVRSSICTHQAQNWSKNWRKWVFKIEISGKCGPPVCLLGAHTFGARLGKCSSNMVPNDLLISYLNSKNSKSYESPHFTSKKWRTFLNGVIYETIFLGQHRFVHFFQGFLYRYEFEELEDETFGDQQAIWGPSALQVRAPVCTPNRHNHHLKLGYPLKVPLAKRWYFW